MHSWLAAQTPYFFTMISTRRFFCLPSGSAFPRSDLPADRLGEDLGSWCRADFTPAMVRDRGTDPRREPGQSEPNQSGADCEGGGHGIDRPAPRFGVKFGSVLRQKRLRLGVSQEEFADMCSLDGTYVGGIERGERNPALVNIKKIAVKIPSFRRWKRSS